LTISVDKSATVSSALPSKVACTPGVTTSPGWIPFSITVPSSGELMVE